MFERAQDEIQVENVYQKGQSFFKNILNGGRGPFLSFWNHSIRAVVQYLLEYSIYEWR